ncbi:MAG TPA: hypothetical protein VD997_14335 [Phycisphaerales bacterium]|nr:hypothetical protein [Phycisphaerales bacterium]
MVLRTAGAAALALLLAAAHASADFTVSYTSGKISVVDNDTGRTVISGDPIIRHRVYTPANGDAGTIEPTVAWLPSGGDAAHADGIDLAFTFDNTQGTTARRPGPLYVPGITFGLPVDQRGRVRTRDFFLTGQAQDITTNPLDSGWNMDQEAKYPGSLFAPVAFLHAGEYALGVSLQYPLVDPAAPGGAAGPNQYAHRVALGIHVFPPAEGEPRTWEVQMILAARDFTNADPALTEGLVPAGESRTYVVSVRAMRTSTPTGGAWSPGGTQTIPENAYDTANAPQQWLRLFQPYREYFTARYGGVRYTADPRPVLGCTTTQADLISASNPYGFVEFSGGGGRPYPEGWDRWHQELLFQHARGWARFMMWTPTGLFPTTPSDYNFPFQFTSRWSAQQSAGAGPAVLADITNSSGRELGLWWGNSTQVMTSWPPTAANPPLVIDPANPTHVALARQEVDGAVQIANTRVVGLDAFAHLPVWQSYHWLRQLQQWYPGVRFLIEPMPCDILATLAPGFTYATRPNWASTYRIVTPHYLAQLLVPGHELWGSIQKHHLHDELGRWPEPLEIVERARYFAAMGYVPIVFGDAAINGIDLSAQQPRVMPITATCSADFNNDGDTATDQDIEAFFACIGGNCCPTCGSADFNADGDTATDQDIESFFRVIGGGAC